MKNDIYTNPALEMKQKIKEILLDYCDIKKPLWIKFDKGIFITNILKGNDIKIDDNIGTISYNSNDVLFISPSKDWIEDGINRLDKIHRFDNCDENKDNIYIQGYIKKLNSHLAFGSISKTWHSSAYEIALLIFKILNTKSDNIKERCSGEMMKLYDMSRYENDAPVELIQVMIKTLKSC